MQEINNELSIALDQANTSYDVEANLDTLSSNNNDSVNETKESESPKCKPKKMAHEEQVQFLLELMSDAVTFHTPTKKPYASIILNGGLHTYAIGRGEFADILQKKFYDENKMPPTSKALKDAIAILASAAVYDGDEQNVCIRLCEIGKTIYYDLASNASEIVAIDEAGWRTIKNINVPFLRFPNTTANTVPEIDGDLKILRKYFNLSNEDQWVLLLSWILGSFRPYGPYPILILTGEHGSAKSTATRILQALTDPVNEKPPGFPKSERDFAITTARRRILLFDNISEINENMSDLLCRAATGGSFRARKNYSDDQEVIVNIQNPIVVNGIGTLVRRGDLLDRSILIELPLLSESKRKSEDEVMNNFNKDRPQILGSIFSVVSCALKEQEKVNAENLPRMADFAKWIMSIEELIGLTKGDFLRIYKESIKQSNLDVINSDPLALSIIKLIETKKSWKGSATDLINILSESCAEEFSKVKSNERSLKTISTVITRLTPPLREQGIQVSTGRNRSKRFIEIEKIDAKIN